MSNFKLPSALNKNDFIVEYNTPESRSGNVSVSLDIILSNQVWMFSGEKYPTSVLIFSTIDGITENKITVTIAKKIIYVKIKESTFLNVGLGFFFSTNLKTYLRIFLYNGLQI